MFFFRQHTFLKSTRLQNILFLRNGFHKYKSSNEDIGAIPKWWWRQQHEESYKNWKQLLKRDSKIETYVSQESSQMLCDTFGMNLEKCKQIVKHKRLEECSHAHLKTMAEFLKNSNVKTEHIIRAPWLLWQQKNELIMKMSLLKQDYLFDTTIDGLGFTIYDITLINKYNDYFEAEADSYPEHRNKIYYIASRLKLPIELLTMKMVQAWNVFHLRRDKIDSVIDVLLEFNIKPGDIMNGIYVFLHNTELMQMRLARMKEVSSQPPKLWKCYCTDFIFERAYIKHKNNVSIDLVNLIMTEFGCDKKTSKLITEGRLSKKSPFKIKVSIDLLKKAGIEANTIRNNMELLQASPIRIIERFELLKKRLAHVPGYILVAHQKKFDRYLQRLDELKEF